MRMDSRPCAEDHSSPRSPRHVLRFVSKSNVIKIFALYLPENRQTDLASRINVGVEPSASPICGDGCNTRCFGRVVFGELDSKFKEAKLIRGVGGTDNQRSYMTYVDITAGNG